VYLSALAQTVATSKSVALQETRGKPEAAPMAESFGLLTGLCGHFGRPFLEKRRIGRTAKFRVILDRSSRCLRFAPVSSVAFKGGIGLNLLNGNLTTLAQTSIGPENPGDNHDYSYLNDITTTWEVTKAFTSITDLNLIVNAIDRGKWGGGVAQYFTYAVNDWLQVGFRGEIFRDSSGFYVAPYRANNDFLHISLQGGAVPFDPCNLSGGDTTYLGVTGGVTIKAPVPKPFAGFMIRPEVRYDISLNNTTPFDQNTSRHQWTIGLDAILEF
jgi:Putative beta-barrel porin-2, OmpL-like. bbp2